MNGFYGSVNGNIIGTLYFLMFQCAGFLYIRRLFPQKELVFRLLVGSVLGSATMDSRIVCLFLRFFPDRPCGGAYFHCCEPAASIYPISSGHGSFLPGSA